jgi:glycosyltransferase involved in cell wall biosynthesis
MAAEAVGLLGGRLDLYTNATRQDLAACGLTSVHVRYRGFLSPAALHHELRSTADALLLPMSFERSDRTYMSLCMPSKLVEYTTVGLPVVVWGPGYSGGARWVTAHAGPALVVTTPSVADFSQVLRRLAEDPNLAQEAAHRLAEAGREEFDHARVLRTFRRALETAAAPSS